MSGVRLSDGTPLNFPFFIHFSCYLAVQTLYRQYGEMSERFKEPVLKTGESETAQGFESLSLRHLQTYVQATN